MLDKNIKEELVTQCLNYVRSQALPEPLPSNRAEYGPWRDKAMIGPEVNEDAEDAWFDVDRMITEQPDDALELISEIAARCQTESESATLGAGLLNTFVRVHGATHSAKIQGELLRNNGLRIAYHWL